MLSKTFQLQIDKIRLRNFPIVILNANSLFIADAVNKDQKKGVYSEIVELIWVLRANPTCYSVYRKGMNELYKILIS